MLLLKQRDCPIGIHVFEGISVFSRYSLVWYIPCVCMHAYLHIFMLVVTNHTAAILCTSVNFSGRYWQLHSYIAKLVFYDGVCGQMFKQLNLNHSFKFNFHLLLYEVLLSSLTFCRCCV